MKEPATLAVRARVQLEGDDELQKRLPSREGIVELTLQDGRTLRHRTTAVRGTAENPMTRHEVEEKCIDLLVPRLGLRRSRELCRAVWNIERVRDVRELRPLLVAGR